MKLWVLLSATLLFASCGVKRSPVNFGTTTVAELKSQLGEPIETKSVPVEKGQILIYPDNEKYKVKGDIVTHAFFGPESNENSLIFWKHKLKNCETVTSKISEPKGHEAAEYELKCSEQGISVIYSENSGFVSRIIQYEKK